MPNRRGKERGDGDAIHIQRSIQSERWDRYMLQHRGRDRYHGQIPIFIRPYHAKEENKALINKEMKSLCSLGILKQGCSPYSSWVILISWKLPKTIEWWQILGI